MIHYPTQCIGRPAGQLRAGETVFAPGEPEIRGTVLMQDGKPFVRWEDEPDAEPGRLRGMVHTLRRDGDPDPICRS